MNGAGLVRADALRIPLRDESVDLIITSPPYFALRSYQDDGEHYAGQIGSEPTPRDFLEALWAVTRECVRVLKPAGSLFVNLGDKYAGSGGHNNAGIARNLAGMGDKYATRRNAPGSYTQDSGGVRAKSLLGLPWRYALGCIDELELILRAEIVWSKPNGLPESCRDRVRRSHEQWFHLTREGHYYTALDELREPSTGNDARSSPAARSRSSSSGVSHRALRRDPEMFNPLGKVPGSVWTIPTEPLRVPAELGDHFAAFPQEWPRRLILGWSPPAICIECGDGRAPVVDKEAHGEPMAADHQRKRTPIGGGPPSATDVSYSITGYACACTRTGPELIYGYGCSGQLDPTPPTRPAVVLDPFGGTGTVAMVARALGRFGVSLDLSADYLRLARWRVFDSGHAAKSERRTWAERQGSMFEEAA